MSEPFEQSNHSPSLGYSLDTYGKLILEKLARWAKFVGIMNIITGSLYSLTILVFSIPTVLMGIITILMGIKLNNASNHLKYALYNQDSPSLTMAMDQVRSYMTINGILQIITLVVIGLVLFFVAAFGWAIFDFFDENGFDYTLTHILSQI